MYSRYLFSRLICILFLLLCVCDRRGFCVRHQTETSCLTDDDELAEQKVRPLTVKDHLEEALASWGRSFYECRTISLPRDVSCFVETVPCGQKTDETESYLIKLGNLLHQDKDLFITNALVAVSGMGGVGKSSLALRYAHLAHQHHVYDLIVWWDSETKNTLINQYRHFLMREKGTGSHLDTEGDVVTSLSTYVKDKGYQKYLFIYDNVPSSKGFIDLFPQGSGHCLITSRCRMGWPQLLSLDVFSRAESIDYLMRSSGIEDTPQNRDLAGEIAEEVGDLPLAFDHVLSYLEAVHTDPSTYSFASYLEKFRGERDTLDGYDFESDESEDELLDFEAADKSKPTVAKTWLMTMQKLTGKSDPYKCRELMMYCSYLAPHNIPIGLFKTGDKKSDQKVEKGLRLLSEYSMLKRTDETVSVHRLVQWVIRKHYTPLETSFCDNKMPDMIVDYVKRSFIPTVSDDKIGDKTLHILQHISALIENAETTYPSYIPPNSLLLLGHILSLGFQNDLLSGESKQDISYHEEIKKMFPRFVRGREDFYSIDALFSLVTLEGKFKDAHPFIHVALGKYYSVAKHYTNAISWWRKAADQGYMSAQYNLGEAFRKGEGVEQDDGKAFEWYKKAAEQGHVASQFNLGWMFAEGRGVDKNDAEAISWFSQAAEQGHALAQCNLGVMYKNGQGVEKDDAKAVEFYRKAAEKGNSEAQLSLGGMYANGQGVDQDYGKAFAWWRKAADQGHAGAQYNLGVMYKEGHGVDQDYKKAVEWYGKAAEQGNSDAQFTLGRMYEDGRGIKQNDGKAVEWYVKAAEQGYAGAQCYLGGMYDQGRGVEQDYREAFAWYRKAAEKGHAASQFNLGWMFAEGRGVERNDGEAVEWYRKSAEQGHALAQYNLGLMYKEGLGVDQDYDKAFEFYLKAAEQGYAGAQFSMGGMYAKGQGVQQDDAKVFAWWSKAADQGYPKAQYNLGLMYNHGLGIEQNDAKAFEWYEKAAEQGNELAQFSMGWMYDQGLGVEQDYVKAFECYRKAAEQGYAKAQCYLGSMYDEGQGVQQDYDKAVEWYRKSAEQGHANAQFNLAVMYDQGQGVQQDYAKAVEWYQKSAEQGHSDAQFNLALIYDQGQGVDQDDAKAVEWYQKSAEQGHAEAQCYLGWMYDQGLGVQQDDAKAVEWYQKSAEQGNSDAQFTLGRMYHHARGIEQNDSKAVEWYRKAATQGNALAQKKITFFGKK